MLLKISIPSYTGILNRQYLQRLAPSTINTMFNTILQATPRLSSHLDTSRMILPQLQAQSRTARTLDLLNRRPMNATQSLTTPTSSAQDILKSSISDNQSRFGSPHQDNPFQGFMKGSRKTKMSYRYEAPTRKTGQQATSPTTSKSSASSFGGFRSLFTHVAVILDNPREYAINRWTDRVVEIYKPPTDQSEILKRLQAVERRQELHSYMAYCVVSGFVLATALSILVAFAASEIRDKRNRRNNEGGSRQKTEKLSTGH